MFAVASLPTLSAVAARNSAKGRRAVRVRAEAGDKESPVATTSTTGQPPVSPAQAAETLKASTVTSTPTPPPPKAPAPVGFFDAMAFTGPAPETLNGRMAMVGFVAAMAAEFNSNESVLRQLADEPTGVILLVTLFTAATLIPLTKGTKSEAFGPFTPAAEMMNGRAAMLGFALLLVSESVTGKAFF